MSTPWYASSIHLTSQHKPSDLGKVNDRAARANRAALLTFQQGEGSQFAHRHPAVNSGEQHERCQDREENLCVLQMRAVQVCRMPLLQVQGLQRKQVKLSERSRKAPFVPSGHERKCAMTIPLTTRQFCVL